MSWIDDRVNGLDPEYQPMTYEDRAVAAEIALENLRREVALDKRRLDWLDENIFSREMDKLDAAAAPDSNMWVMFAPKGVQGTARNIIDAAIKRAEGDKQADILRGEGAKRRVELESEGKVKGWSQLAEMCRQFDSQDPLKDATNIMNYEEIFDAAKAIGSSSGFFPLPVDLKSAALCGAFHL